VTLTTAEALAIVQSLIEASADEDVRPPYGPPLPENVLIRADGSVTSRACAATPTVLEVAILLDRLLPHGQIPGGLRYTLGRALHEVAAPPFDSLDAFSQALSRFEAGARTEMVRGVFARAAAQESGAAMARAVFGLPFAAAILAGLALIGAGESMRVSRPSTASAMAGAQMLADARPILFNPPPTTVLVAERRSLIPSALYSDSPTQRVLVKSALKQPLRQRRPGVLSRVIPRVRIRFDEL